MSTLPKDTIEVIAESIGIKNLSPDVAATLAPDVEYGLREIMQEAIKCMRHSRRTILTTKDVNNALSIKNLEPIYGYTSGNPLRFRRAVGHPDLFYIVDKEFDVKDVIEACLPRAPLDIAAVAHWLAIEGVQPAIPENATVKDTSEDKRTQHNKNDRLSIDVKLPVKHVLSRELELYFEKITKLIVTEVDSALFKEALVSLATDSGIHALVPYFTLFIADEVNSSLDDLPLLFALMRVLWSLLHNRHMDVKPYLHQVMPSMMTCLVTKQLGKGFKENHWELRDFVANIIVFICKCFGREYYTLQPQITETLLHTLLDPKMALTQHYGAIQGLAALGTSVVRSHILPNLEPYLQLLEPEMLLESQKNEMKRYEAWRVYGALQHAAVRCVCERFKLYPGLLCPPTQSALRTTAKVVTTLQSDNAPKIMSSPSRKRKASEDYSSQRPLKRPVIDSFVGRLPTEPLPDSIGETLEGGVGHTGGESAVGKVPGESLDETLPGGGRRKKRRLKQGNKSVNARPDSWKEEIDAELLLASLVDLFGEVALTFIASNQMSCFL